MPEMALHATPSLLVLVSLALLPTGENSDFIGYSFPALILFTVKVQAVW